MKIGRTLSLLAGMAAMSLALADDTDIYVNPGAGLPVGSEPMVMFTLDYRPNLAATACGRGECDALIEEGWLEKKDSYVFFDVLRAALKKVFDPLEGVRVGLMLNHDNVNNCAGPEKLGCSNGSYVAMGFQLFMEDDANKAKERFHEILEKIPTPQGNQSHSYQGKELFFELFRYLTGQGVYNGHNGWIDYETDAKENLNQDGQDYDWDRSIETDGGKYYISPMREAGQCTKVFTVNPLFQVANQEDDSDNALAGAVAEGGLGIAPREFVDVIKYMHDADLANGKFGTAPAVTGDQSVTSYFLVDPRFINRTTIGYAAAGGTGLPLPLSENPDELVATLQDIFRQILSVSTTFVAASVPVNVFNRAEIVDNVYIALFQVDEGGRPAWQGNVKKVRLSSIDGQPLLVDALGAPAIAADGRIRNDALTYWTVPEALPPPDVDDGQVAGRDGRFVDRGGAGQRLPGFLNGSPGLTNTLGRRVFFDSGSSLAPLNVDNATASLLQGSFGAQTASEALSLIGHMRGLDVDDLDGDGDFTEAREWIFNDPLHSRPLPLNYGARAGYSQSNPAIYLAVASNDGLMHFVRNTLPDGQEAGVEAWAFAPRSTLPAQKILRANAALLSHPYTVDGSPAAYVEDYNNNGTIEPGENAYLYFGLRRGGKAYYALDVTNPEQPELLWSIDKSGDFAELGMTFSTPRVGHIDLGQGPQPILVFAGGYDRNKDTRGVVGTDDTEGNAIYVVDALTGKLLWKARGGGASPTTTVYEHPELVDSIPSTVALADTDGNLLVDRIVVGDTGGNIWRADIGGTSTASWRVTKIASLGRHAQAGKENDRRFFHQPDLVPAEDESGPFDAVLIGSGDRPDPLDLGGQVTNFLYMIKDRNVAPVLGVDLDLTPADLGDVTDNCLQEGGGCGVDLTHGWRLRLELGGEKALATPITIAGIVFFTTYVPGALSPEACAPAEGLGRLYALSLQDASSVINYDTTDDDPLRPDEATTKSDRVSELNSPGIPAEVVSVPPNMILRPDLQVETLNVTTRWRTFWFLEEDSDL